MAGHSLRNSIRQQLNIELIYCPRILRAFNSSQAHYEPTTTEISKVQAVKIRKCIALHSGTSSTKQSSDGMTHQRRTSRLTKDGQSSSSIGSTLMRWLISSGACIRASLKILRLPLLFGRQLSATAPTAVTGLLSSDRRLPDDRLRRYRLRPPQVGSRHCPATNRGRPIVCDTVSSGSARPDALLAPSRECATSTGRDAVQVLS